MKVWHCYFLLIIAGGGWVFCKDLGAIGENPVEALRKNYSVLLEDEGKLAKACQDVKNYGDQNLCNDKNSKNKTCKQIWSVLTNACQDFSSLGQIGDWFNNLFKQMSKGAKKLGNSVAHELKKDAKTTIKDLEIGKKNANITIRNK